MYSAAVQNRSQRRLGLTVFASLFGLAGSLSSVSVAAAEIDDYAARLSALINDYRHDRGRATLAIDRTLENLAREHSATMSKSGKLHHDGFQSRVERSGLAMCVENVGWNYASPKSQLDAWRASSGHDRNMLDPRVQRFGIGVSGRYVTMLACGK